MREKVFLKIQIPNFPLKNFLNYTTKGFPICSAGCQEKKVEPMIKERSAPKVNIRRKQCAKNVRRPRKHYDIHTQTKDGQLVDHKKQDGKR